MSWTGHCFFLSLVQAFVLETKMWPRVGNGSSGSQRKAVVELGFEPQMGGKASQAVLAPLPTSS